MSVLLGAQETIRSQTPGWLIEVSRDTSIDVFAFFKRFEYRAFVFNDRLIETEVCRDREFSNYVFSTLNRLAGEAQLVRQARGDSVTTSNNFRKIQSRWLNQIVILELLLGK